MNYAAIHERQNGLGEGKAGHNDFPADLVECKNVFEHQLSKAALALALARSGVGRAGDNIDKVVSAVSVFAACLQPPQPLSPSWLAHVP